MSDSKSNFPDLKELGAMINKFLQDMKKSVCNIIEDYKGKHETAKPKPAASKPTTPKKPEVKNTKPKVSAAEEKVTKPRAKPKAKAKVEDPTKK